MPLAVSIAILVAGLSASFQSTRIVWAIVRAVRDIDRANGPTKAPGPRYFFVFHEYASAYIAATNDRATVTRAYLFGVPGLVMAVAGAMGVLNQLHLPH